MPNNTAGTSRGAMLLSIALLLAVVNAGVFALAPDDETSSANSSVSDNTAGTTQRTTGATESNQDEDELTLDPSQARPSLDYVPSETISEDKSVSFPVDI